MFGLDNYNPSFFYSVEELIKFNGNKLRNLIGKSIREAWVIWELNSDEWHSDGVIILCFDDMNIEICTHNLNELSITWNEIDVNVALESYDFEEYGKFDFEWRKDSLEQFKLIKGRIVKEIEIFEYKFTTTVTFNKSSPEEIGRKDEQYILNGIGFKLDDGYFSIYNGLDTNALTTERNTTDHRYTKI
jgi:hypothetical protein